MKFKDMGLDKLKDAASITYAPLDEHRPQIEADQLDKSNGIIVLTPAITAQSLVNATDLLT